LAYYFFSRHSAGVTPNSFLNTRLKYPGSLKSVSSIIEKEQRWKKEWEAFYPDKSGYLSIKVVPLWMEVLSPPKGIFGDDKSWLPPRVAFDK
jgi:hypothetical protein